MAVQRSPYETLSLYLHIPFCSVKCSFCAFNVYANMEQLIPAYVEALCHEIEVLGWQATLPVHTIYLGGGTPSLLSVEQVSTILKTCRSSFHVFEDAEISLEANPESAKGNYFVGLREIGVNRLSIGMQSVHDSELELFMRQHRADETVEAVRNARSGGGENFSLDLIYGVPNQTLEQWEQSVKAALDLTPAHLSLYSLQVEPGTALSKWIERGKLPSPDDDLAADMYERADELITAAGLEQYEISTWARPGFECQHNLQYWRHGDYLGIGAGAHGFADGIRYSVVRKPRAYIEQALKAEPASYPLTTTAAEHETIDPDQAMDEFMITGLRCLKEGVERQTFADRFGQDVMDVYGSAIEQMTALRMLEMDQQAIRLTRHARLIANQVLVHFMRERETAG